jgi:hypothetical protein
LPCKFMQFKLSLNTCIWCIWCFVFLIGIGLGGCIHWPYHCVMYILWYWYNTNKAWVFPPRDIHCVSISQDSVTLCITFYFLKHGSCHAKPVMMWSIVHENICCLIGSLCLFFMWISTYFFLD